MATKRKLFEARVRFPAGATPVEEFTTKVFAFSAEEAKAHVFKKAYAFLDDAVVFPESVEVLN